MDHVLGLACTICGTEYGVDQVEYVCPKHGDDGVLDVIYDYPLIARRVHLDSPVGSMWRYLPLLPVDAAQAWRRIKGTVLAYVGWTPLLATPRLGARLGLRQLWVKDDGRQPTASLKDRASAVALLKAYELGYEVVTTASTGNAAAALAGLNAAADEPLRCVILLPQTAPLAKVAQLLVFGATVLAVDGTYDQAFDLCLRAAPAFGWYNRSTGYNPYMSEGKKTVAYEICEQLTAQLAPDAVRGRGVPWLAPDCIVIPVGDGCIIGGVFKGLRDLLALGWIEHMPRLIGVQAAGSAPLVNTWTRLTPVWRAQKYSKEQVVQAALEMQPVEAHTVADSISAGLPRDRIKALCAVMESGGALIQVSDGQILDAIPALARGCGVFAEPAAAAAYAGLVQAVEAGLVGADERVVVLSTGSGLKDIPSAIKTVAPPPVISPDLDAVRRVVEGQ